MYFYLQTRVKYSYPISGLEERERQKNLLVVLAWKQRWTQSFNAWKLTEICFDWKFGPGNIKATAHKCGCAECTLKESTKKKIYWKTCCPIGVTINLYILIQTFGNNVTQQAVEARMQTGFDDVLRLLRSRFDKSKLWTTVDAVSALLVGANFFC